MNEAARDRAGSSQRRHIEHDLLLAALPHPVLVLGDDDRVLYANLAAETFFSLSHGMLKRQTLPDIIAFSSPLGALVGQVRKSGATVNEYGVEVDLPRSGVHRLVDVFAGGIPEQPGLIVLMLQQRSMAQMIERQLTHRAAARSVSGMAAVLAHEIKNPLSGIRGAAQLLEPGLKDEDRALTQLICTETDRIRDLVDRMEVFGDERPLAAEPVNIHSVLDHVKRLAETGFADGIKINVDYDPSLPPLPGNRDKLIQAFLNLVKNAAEGHRGVPRAGRSHRAAHRVPAGRAPLGARHRRARQPAADDRGGGHGRRRPRRAQAPPLRSVRDDQAQGHGLGSGAGGQDHRRPRWRHRVRVGAQEDRVSRAAAAAGQEAEREK